MIVGSLLQSRVVTADTPREAGDICGHQPRTAIAYGLSPGVKELLRPVF